MVASGCAVAHYLRMRHGSTPCARSRHLTLALSLLASTGCGSGVDDLSTIDQSVINGVEVDASLIRSRGLVRVSTLTGIKCSGVLLANDLVLTAGHCLSSNTPTGWTEMFAEYDGQSQDGQRFYWFGTWDRPTLGPDLGLLQLQDGFEINGSHTGFGHAIEPVTSDELAGRKLQIYGRGNNSSTGPDGWDVWRRGEVTGLLKIAPYDDEYAFWDGLTGQMIAPGDSGGPSFIEDEDGVRLVGIHSTGNWPGTCAVTDNCVGQDMLVYPDFWALVGIMDQPYNMYDAIEVFDVWRAELRVGRMDDQDIDTAHWTLTAQNAQHLATNRFEVAAHATGFESADKLGLASSNLYATVLQARPDIIANAELDAFYDIHETEWAQAQRVAMSACRQMGGMVSGYFTGNQNRGSDYELVCFSGGVINRTATWAELDATGYRVNGVVQTPYAQAMRAAQSWCRSRGYVSGYLTGQQHRDIYGITCQHL